MNLSVDILAASILIVDDQLSNVQMLEQLLADVGYSHVTSTTKPEEVSALHRKNAYDLILLDMQMPVMDGFGVMESLKTSSTDSYLPVIVLTAQPGHKLRALQAGAKDFISKPFDIVEVKTRIYNMLEVRLLYKKLADYNRELEATVIERTAELRESEARYRRLTELASDWYWEQDKFGHFVELSGPVREVLGLEGEPSGTDAGVARTAPLGGWNEVERDSLRSIIAERQPFLDYLCHRTGADGSQQTFQISGEPRFDRLGCFIGYRGVGVELAAKH